jgi:hypothetical protein
MNAWYVYILSTGEEPALFRHACPILPLGTDAPHERRQAEYDSTHNCSVRFPVLGLSVPATGWRPDVLGVANGVLAGWDPTGSEASTRYNVRDLAATALSSVSPIQCDSGVTVRRTILINC